MYVQLYWNFNRDTDLIHLQLFTPAVQVLADEQELDWGGILSRYTVKESIHLGVRNFGLGRWIDIPQIDIDTVKRWLQICDRDHRRETSYHPCIPMKTGDSPNFSSLRFIDLELNCIIQWTSKALPIYLALSYVWGSSDEGAHLKLNQETSSWLFTPSSLAKIDNRIPRTIFDAMVLTKLLGRRYLWVDALCIQQDNLFDKNTQIPLMAHIYSQADCTIVAGAGANAWAGLPGVGRDRVGRQYGAHVKGFDLITTRQHFRNWMQNSVWETRGWTLQEKMCSRRMLIFTERQLFFQCKSSLLYEDTNLESEAMNFGGPATAHESAANLFASPASAYTSTVNALCKRSFGHENDILHAFKGIEMWLYDFSLKEREKGGRRFHDLVEYFHWGFPESIFDAVVCWSFPVHNPSWRRDHQSFPGWCWAGWKLEPTLNFTCPFPGPMVAVKFAWFVFDENSRLRRLRTLPERIGTRQVPSEEHKEAQDEISLSHIPTIPSHISKSHLLFFWATESLLTVDQHGREYSYLQRDYSALQNCTFIIRNPYTGDQIGEITLHKEWRSRQPDKLPFITVAKACDGDLTIRNPDFGWYVMLVEWIDGIAHRVQTLERPIQNEIWDRTNPQRRLVSLA